jgi:hypothetical protein
MKAPSVCVYCDGQGNSTAGGPCGFCVEGKPLDTEADWAKTWGRTFLALQAARDKLARER